MSKRIGLASVLEQLSDELHRAALGAQQRSHHYLVLAECEVELAVEVEESKSGEVSFWVVKAGASARSTSENRLRVKLAANSAQPLVLPAIADGSASRPRRQADLQGLSEAEAPSGAAEEDLPRD